MRRLRPPRPAPHPAHVPTRVVISTANTCCRSRQPRCRPVSGVSSQPPVGPKRSVVRGRIVAELDERVCDGLDERRRAADVDARRARRAGADLREHLGVDAPRIARPAGGLHARQRVHDAKPSPRRAARARRGRSRPPSCATRRAAACRHVAAGRRAVAEHRHQRHDARAAADEEQRPARRRLPDEVAADRAAELELVARAAARRSR